MEIVYNDEELTTYVGKATMGSGNPPILIDAILEEYDYKFYMFENLGNYLPPLNY